MPQMSRWAVELPEVSLPTLLFGSPTASLPDAVAFADAGRPDELFMTWDDVRLWSQRFAAGLRRAGLNRGDRVLILSPNSIIWPVLFNGILMAGGIYSASNARAIPREIAHGLELIGAKFLLTSRENLAKALEAAKMAGLTKDRIFIIDDAPLERDNAGEDDKSTGVKHWRHLLSTKEVGRHFAWDELTPEESKTRDCSIMFSSGTTGLPKGVQLSHHSVIANTVQTDFVMSLDPQLRTHEDSAARSRWLCCLPLYHGLALVYYCVLAIFRRVPTYIMQQYDTDLMLNHIQRFKITELHLVPPMMVAMVKHQGLRSGQFDISSVGKTFSIAAPLGAEVSMQYESLWPKGKMNVKQGLGATETACNTLGWDPTLTAPPGSVGEPMPNNEIKLVDDNGNEVPRGQHGEILVRSPNRMTAYWNNPKATEETLPPDGWLRTGDVARQDNQGYYYIVDRKKEMIKVKGVQVAPAELEAILLDHPGINDAAVVGVKSDDGEEKPRAFIVRNAKLSVTKEEVSQFLSERVSSIKRLTGGVTFVDAIPKTPSGKILRRQIRDSIAKESKL